MVNAFQPMFKDAIRKLAERVPLKCDPAADGARAQPSPRWRGKTPPSIKKYNANYDLALCRRETLPYHD